MDILKDILYLLIGIGWIFLSTNNLTHIDEKIRKKSVLDKHLSYKSKISFFKAVNLVLLSCGIFIILILVTDFL